MDVMAQPSTFFVTGATGFIGSRLVAELVRRGHDVRALVRPASSRRDLQGKRITVVEGDVGDRGSLLRGMEGCSGVFHLAAYARNWARDPRTFFEINVEGTRNVLDAARAAGVGRIVLTSTMVTFGPTPPSTVGDEKMPRMTPRFHTEYEESKTVGEQEALRMASEGLPVVVVNPTRVYGPGKLTEGNSVTVMIDLYDRGRFPFLLAGGVNVGNYAFVDDLVRGHVLAMERGRVGERYILGGENVSLRRFFDLVDEATGKRHLRVGLPAWLAMAYSRLEGATARWFGHYPLITPGWVETFVLDWAYSSAKAERELGYTVTPLKEGIFMTCEWLHRRRAVEGAHA
jgi:nucleoside-diphosphate-sugar epimerase